MPVNLDDRIVNAVSARIELDLRLGAVFTRFTTLTLQDFCETLKDRTLSYGKFYCLKRFNRLTGTGSCQFPTLGFVVDRYFKVKNFKPEAFWSIKVMQLRDDVEVSFSWKRHRLFDRAAVIILFERCLTARRARISKLQNKPTCKWRPLPLTTVELQKLGSMFLRMSSQTVMMVRFLQDHRPGFIR